MQPLNQSADCVSNLELDEWAAGELTPSEAQRVLDHMVHCERCRTRREALAAEQRAFLLTAPTFREHAEYSGQSSPRLADGPRRLAQSSPPRRVSWQVALGGLAVAAALCLIFVPKMPNATRTRIKGTPHLGFFVKHGNAVRRGANRQTVYASDLIRFVYTSDRDYYLAIFGRDPRAVTVYYPAGDRAQRIVAGHDLPLDFSVQLDDELGTEQVVALFCQEAFAIEPVRAALAAGAALPAATSSCHRDVITLTKLPAK